MKAPLSRVLCVDDEPKILSAIARNLRGALDLTLANSGAEALTIMREANEPFAALVTDMRMPEMNGVALLSHARKEFPDTTRILLTGYAEMATVIEAVNDGNIFRFLSKPCSTTQLLDAIRAGVRQFELVTAERVLLEETLRGSIDAMMGVLALASPTHFGRASRVKRVTQLLCSAAGVTERWQIEVAAQFAQIGRIALPESTVAKLSGNVALTDAETAMVAGIPEVTREIIGKLPRLDAILELLELTDRHYDGNGPGARTPAGEDIPIGARILKLAFRIEDLSEQGCSPGRILDILRVEAGAYDPQLLRFVCEQAQSSDEAAGPRGITLLELRIGMRIVEPVRARTGVLLVAAGQEVTQSLLHRIQNFHATVGLELPLWVEPTAEESDLAQPEVSC